jgi:hypothetical protein
MVPMLSPHSAGGKETEALSVVKVLRDPVGLSGAHDIEIQDGIAFVAGKGASLAVIDVRIPEAPAVLWTIQDPTKFENAESVLPLSKNRWLIGTRDAFLFDAADPKLPRQLGKIESRPVIDQINGFARYGDQVFGASKTGYLFAIDVTDADAIALKTSRNTRAMDNLSAPHDVAVSGAYVVTVSPEEFGRTGKPGKLGLYRTADFSFLGSVEDRRLSGANRVRAHSGLAYTANSLTQNSARTDGLRSNVAIVDLSDGSHPKVLGSVDFPGERGPNGLELAGSVLFAAGGNVVQAIDVSDPAAPRELARLTSPEAFSGGADDAHDLVYRDGYLFVTAQTSHAMVVIRVRDQNIIRLAHGQTANQGLPKK